MKVPEVLGNGNYIFNVPSAHIDELRAKVYPSFNECATVCYQEIGEFLQALGKYQLTSKTSAIEERHSMRLHIVEKMTHVLVCLAMIARSFGVTQDEIDTQIEKKALPGVNYPFSAEKHHMSLEDLFKALNHCVPKRKSGQQDPDHSCTTCTMSDGVEMTITCRPMIQEALYYLEQCEEYRQGINSYKKNEK